jgi:iron complex transport system substrate-binding protein
MKNIKKLSILLVAILLLSLSLVACGPQTNDSSNTANSQNTIEQTVFPYTIKDANGFDLTLKTKPEKIISLTLVTDEILPELTSLSKIQSMTNLSLDEGVSNIIEIAKKVPVKLDADIEKVISMKPDLVFVADWKEKEFVQQLRDAGINVFQFKSPITIEDVKQNITDFSKMLGEVDKGQSLNKWIDDKLNTIQDAIKSLDSAKKLTVLYYNPAFGNTYAKGTSMDEVLTRAGLINIPSRENLSQWPAVSKEQIIAWDPDVILLPSWSYDKIKDPKAIAEQFKKDASFVNLKAVKNNRVLMLPDKHLLDNAQYMVLGIEDVAKAAYPDLFAAK